MSTVKILENCSETLFWSLYCWLWTSSSSFGCVWTFFSCLTRKIFLSVGFEDILGKFEENNILAESSKAPKDSFSLLGEVDDNSSNPQTGNPNGLANDRGKLPFSTFSYLICYIFIISDHKGRFEYKATRKILPHHISDYILTIVTIKVRISIQFVSLQIGKILIVVIHTQPRN